MGLRLLEELAQVLAVDVTHHITELVLDLRDLSDLDDVRVMQQGRDLRFVAKQPHELLVEGEVREDTLDDDVRVGLGGVEDPGEVELRHTADRQSTHDGIAP